MDKEHQKGVVALIILDLLYASIGIFCRYFSTDLGLFQQMYFRIFPAFIFGCLIFYRHIDYAKILKMPAKEWLILIFRSTSLYVIGSTLGTQAYIVTKYSNAAFIMSLPMTAILGVILFKERLTWKSGLLIAFSFLGMILISVKDYTHLFMWETGEIFALIAIILVTLGTITRKWHSDYLNDKEISQLILIISSVLLFSVSCFSGEKIYAINWTSTLILVIIGASLINTFYMFFANYGFQHVETILANNILTLQAVFSLIIGFIIYHETPNLKEILGGAIIFFSAIGMNKLDNLKSKTPVTNKINRSS